METVLFYENNKAYRRVILGFAIFMTVGSIGTSVGFTHAYINDNLASWGGSLLASIVGLVIVLLFTFSLWLLFFLRAARYALKITYNNLIFNRPVGGKNSYPTMNITDFSVIRLWGNVGKLILLFGDSQIVISTRRYVQLVQVLKYFIKRNEEILQNKQRQD